MKILTLAVLLASSAASAADIMTPEALRASPDIDIAADMARCAGISLVAAELLKDARQKDEAAIANLQRVSGGYAAVSLFYIKSHNRKNGITDDPADWVMVKVNKNRTSMMFADDAELRKEMERCDKVDLPVARATHGP
jgi:opacity protein-like surface antigen